jgi:hypothetical protein
MAVLYDKSKRGKRAALREVLYDQLVATVWPSLLHHAAQHWREEDDGGIYAWHTNVLRLWVKRLRSDEGDLDEGVRQLVERATRNPAEFSLAISAALQRDDQARQIERMLKEMLT